MDMVFCRGCGKKIHESASTCPHCGAPQSATSIHVGSSYDSYDQVPFYRKQWFFWIMYFTISPIAIGILLFGDVYYPSKGRVKSFGIANRIGAGIIALIVFAGVATNFDSNIQQKTALTDVSGVWRANQDGAMVTLKLDGKTKAIDINGKNIPVTVKSYDNENKIISLTVNNDPRMVWTIRQVFDKDGRFTLNITLQDGTQDNLSFIRDL